MIDIKRKIAEASSPSNVQLVPATKEVDFDKLSKEANRFNDELGSLKKHQSDLERVTKVIYNQNTQLLKENKLLWNELIKSK